VESATRASSFLLKNEGIHSKLQTANYEAQRIADYNTRRNDYG